jgi:hypothetical protein
MNMSMINKITNEIETYGRIAHTREELMVYVYGLVDGIRILSLLKSEDVEKWLSDKYYFDGAIHQLDDKNDILPHHRAVSLSVV